jgi:anti-sigma B factor antagonist
VDVNTDAISALPEGTVVVELPFEISYDNAQQVSIALASALIAGVTTMIVNLADSTFMDTSGIREIVKTYKLAAARQATLKIVASPHIRRLLELTAIDQIIPINSSVSEALTTTPRVD